MIKKNAHIFSRGTLLTALLFSAAMLVSTLAHALNWISFLVAGGASLPFLFLSVPLSALIQGSSDDILTIVSTGTDEAVQKKILYIGNDTNITRLLASHLSDCTVEQITTSCQELDIDKIHTTMPGLVIVDLTQNPNSCLRYCKEVRTVYSSASVPILALMERPSDSSDFLKTLSSDEINDFVVLPIHEDELLFRVLKLLNLARRNLALTDYSRKLAMVLDGTQQITTLRDPLTAATLTSAYLRRILGKSIALHYIALPKSLQKLDGVFNIFTPMEGLSLLVDDRHARDVELLEERKISEIKKIELYRGNLWLPVVHRDRLLALLIFDGVNDALLQKNLKYIESMANSLALVISNIRNIDQSNLAQIGQMASGIIHDLKNYMVSIRNSARLASDESLSNAEKKLFLDVIHRESQHILEMAHDILDFSKSEIRIAPQRIDLTRFMTEVAQSLFPMFYEREINCFIDDVPDGITAFLDPGKFKRVIFNIAQNASTAMKKGGQFAIHIRHEKGLLYFDLTDNGCGIPEEIVETFFEPFVTGDPQNGTGLGMTISKRIVEAHKGVITFDTGATGTTFHIRLPIPA